MFAGKPEDVAKGAHRRGGWRQRQGTKVDTRQIALDRQQAMEPPCSIGASGNPSAFRPFSSPSGRHNSTPSERDLGGSQACDRPGAASAQPLGGQSHAATAQQAQQHACDEGETNDALAGMHGQQQQPQASAKAAQSHDEGRASAHGPDRPVAGPSNGAPGLPAGAASAGCLEAPGDTAMAEQFRDMGGDAWKVFYMASRMGLRPDVIQKAATRLRSLQQQPE